jgi:hypothetical protein
MNARAELSKQLIEEIARELILEDEETLDEELFVSIMKYITKEGSGHSVFDAPLIYQLLKAEK